MSGPISFTVKPPSAPHRPSPLGNGGRSGPPSRRLFENGHDDEDEDDHRDRHRSRRVREERVDGFRNGKSHGEPQEKPLVIPSIPNRDWRATVQKRAPSYRPEERREDGPIVTHERSGDGQQRAGLRRIVKTEQTTAITGNEELNGSNGSTTGHTETVATSLSSDTPDVKPEPMTLEQQALAELLAGDQKQETAEERAQRDLVIAMEEGKEMTEDEAYKRDVEALPEESTLEDYAAIPVSAFGLAMVRGMGYDPKSASNTTVHEPKLRPQLLGLGATPMDPSIRPTHSKHASAKDRQAERKAKTGRGFNASTLLVKQGKDRDGDREGSSVTPSGSRSESRRVSPDVSGSERRRRRDDEDEYYSGRESKRERNDDGDGHRSRDERDRDRDGTRDRRREREYETEDERARRKARERRDRAREYETEEERARRKERERWDRDRDRDRDRYEDDRDRDRDRRRGDDGERRRDR